MNGTLISILSVIAVKSNFGMIGVAIATLISNFVYSFSLFIIISSHYLKKDFRFNLKFISKTLTPYLYVYL